MSSFHEVDTPPIDGLVDHLFRHWAGQMVSTLTRILGPEHLDLAEDVTQESMLQALKTWRINGVPENPRAWLLTVARNRALDRLRRRHNLDGKLAVVQAAAAGDPDHGAITEPSADDELGMMFLCCHPSLSQSSQITLTLKTVGGLSATEIGRALLTRRQTIAQRLVRAKRTLRANHVEFELPDPDELPVRLTALLEVLYLIFNEGYAATEGDDLVRGDLCGEAIRLGTGIADHPCTCRPEVHALLALMYLQASRLPARTGDDGRLVILAEQDRSLWDRHLAGLGFGHMARSCTGERLTRFHIEAAVAAVHASAQSWDETNWARILQLYDQLATVNPSPVVTLNRAVALSMVDGPAAAIAAIDAIRHHPALQDYYLLPATLGQLYGSLGDIHRAVTLLRRARTMPCSLPERRFLEARIEALLAARPDP